MPGYGLGGPWGNYVGFGTAFEYTSVSASVTGFEDEPPKQGFFCDPTVGYHTVAAILVALELREQTGKGSVVEVPQSETLDTLYAPEWIAVQHGAPVPERAGNKHAWMAPHDAYQVAGEDAWITIAVDSDEAFRSLTDYLGVAALAEDPRFATVAARKEHEAALDERIAEAVRDRDQHTLERELQSRGVMAMRVTEAAEATEDENLQHIHYFQWMDRELTGNHPSRTLPFRFSGVPMPNVLPPPLLGEHNHEVLADLLALSEDEIRQLEEEQVIGNAMVMAEA
jgi:crotonobetainyl-CoA:carnitine CoA-transferase CaiB-like acyl-CoA transferase